MRSCLKSFLRFLENANKMPKFKKLLGGKNKSSKLSKSKESLNSSTGSLSGINNNKVEIYDVKEKDLPKLHKAAWNADLGKLKQLSGKKINWNEFDKQHR